MTNTNIVKKQYVKSQLPPLFKWHKTMKNYLSYVKQIVLLLKVAEDIHLI